MFATIEKFEKFALVQYYTIQFEGEDESETDHFLRRLMDDTDVKEEFDYIVRLIEAIGNRGAKPFFFRFENQAQAIPPSLKFVEVLIGEKRSFSIRLYCMRITDEVVILFNGGIKTTQTAQDCPNVKEYFELANRLAKRIDKMFVSKELTVSNHLLIGEMEFEL